MALLCLVLQYLANVPDTLRLQYMLYELASHLHYMMPTSDPDNHSIFKDTLCSIIPSMLLLTSTYEIENPLNLYHRHHTTTGR